MPRHHHPRRATGRGAHGRRGYYRTLQDFPGTSPPGGANKVKHNERGGAKRPEKKSDISRLSPSSASASSQIPPQGTQARHGGDYRPRAHRHKHDFACLNSRRRAAEERWTTLPRRYLPWHRHSWRCRHRQECLCHLRITVGSCRATAALRLTLRSAPVDRVCEPVYGRHFERGPWQFITTSTYCRNRQPARHEVIFRRTSGMVQFLQHDV